MPHLHRNRILNGLQESNCLQPFNLNAMNTLPTVSRVLLFVCGLALLVVLYVPLWRIELNAPQYPEGLMLLIYPNRLGGSVDIINGLNHYIGMKTLHEKDFAEFGVLPGIIIFFSIAFALVALTGKRKWMYALLVLVILFGIIGMIDFWRWEYQYGHDLNPDAAIRIPGMAYQPPLIGFKQLLNFGAYSVPDAGGWIFIAAGAVLFALVFWEWKKARKMIKLQTPVTLVVALVSVVSFSSCNSGPEPIRFGKDNCQFCKMTISDVRFTAELISTKGKVFKFDDAHCLISYLRSGDITQKEVAGIFLSDYSGTHNWIKAEQAYLLQGESFKSPMNGNIAAFALEDSMKKTAAQFNAGTTSWADLQK
jgi:copper chaperone NosL